jgi:hypothetical protein
MCRTWGHPWEPTDVQKDGAIWIQGLRCNRCGKERKAIIGRYGARNGNRYKDPEGYKVPGGLSPKERNQLTLLEVKTKWK